MAAIGVSQRTYDSLKQLDAHIRAGGFAAPHYLTSLNMTLATAKLLVQQRIGYLCPITQTISLSKRNPPAFTDAFFVDRNSVL